MSPHPAITITDKNSSPVKYFIVLSLHPRVEKHPITEIQARMRITRQDAKLSSLHPEHLPVRPADPHPVLRPSRRRLQSTVVVRFGRWAPHLLKTIIPALPHPIPIVIFRTAPHNINQAGGGPAIQPLNFKCFCLAVVYDVTIPLRAVCCHQMVVSGRSPHSPAGPVAAAHAVARLLLAPAAPVCLRGGLFWR
ncbi:hypothetical protein BANRA_02556 [Klebsiella pneumoniae]|nr:hypothetical protein BANRA_02556 [Klebsiella pneumoniae]